MSRRARHVVSLTSYGLAIDINVDDATVLRRMSSVLPPDYVDRAAGGRVDVELAVRGRHPHLDVVDADGIHARGVGRTRALHVVDTRLRLAIALRAADRIFIHAGVVTLGERALLVPGRSFTGKSTLVAALIEAGATYFSDEYAVLDAEGAVCPYARPLSLRSPDGRSSESVRGEALGSPAPKGPAAVAMVVATRHRPGAHWAPTPMPVGDTALALLSNAVAARSRPIETMQAISAAARGALGWRGERGEAQPSARAMLRMLTDSNICPRTESWG